MALSLAPQRSYAITVSLVLPPGFQGRRVEGDPWVDAMNATMSDQPGNVFWSAAGGLCRATILLAPDRPLKGEVVVNLGLLAALDALAVMAPPHVPLHMAPPATIVIDGAAAGAIRSAQAAGEVPSWAILGFEIAVAPDQASPGDTPERTCLREEGFGDVTPADVLQHICRHLLGWIDVWQEEGDAALPRALANHHPRQSAA